MKNFQLKKSMKTPSIFINRTGILYMSGRSYMDNALEFYKPIMGMIDNISPEIKSVEVKLDFNYLNTSSIKCVLDILKLIKSKGVELYVTWTYEVDDTDIKELGEYYAKILNLEFNMVCVKPELAMA